MNKLFKSLTAIILCSIMCVGLIPTSVFALSDATAVTITATDGTQTVLASNESGAGYSYDSESHTLTLNNWSGRQIIANGNINIKLIGNNTVTMVDSEKTLTGIYVGSPTSHGVLNIYADEEATLSVIADGLTEASTLHGIDAITYLRGNVSLNISLTNIHNTYYGATVSATWGSLFIAGSNNHININATGYGSSVCGMYNGSFIIEQKNCPETMVNNTANITVNNLSENTGVAVSDISIDNAGIELNISADNADGDITKRIAIDSLLTIRNCSEGTVINIKKGTLKYYPNNNIDNSLVTTTPADNNYRWKNISTTAWGNYYMADLDGEIIDNAVLVHSTPDPDNAPVWVGDGIISIPELKVGQPLYQVVHDSSYGIPLYTCIRGLTAPRNHCEYKIIEGSLPAGITLDSSYGYIYGTPTSPCDAGEITVRCTDTVTDKYVDFKIPCGKVTEPDKFITVDGSTIEMRTSSSGKGWSYDGSTSTLTLDDYNGGVISSEKDFNIKLVGNNTVTMADGSGNVYGIYATDNGSLKNISISADASATLSIVADGLSSASYYHGIYGHTCLGDNVTLNITMTNLAGAYLYGTYGSVKYAGNNNTVNATVTGNANYVYGVYNGSLDFGTSTVEKPLANNKACVSVNNLSGGISVGTSNLYIYSTVFDLTVSADNNGGSQTDRIAINNLLYMRECLAGSKLTVTKGIVLIYSSALNNRDNSMVSTTPANDTYWWKNIGATGVTSQYCIADVDGQLLENIVLISNSDRVSAPRYISEDLISIPDLMVGESLNIKVQDISYGLRLSAGIHGVNDMRNSFNNCKYEIIEGSLPGGLTLSSESGAVSGYATIPTDAGTVTVRCTDKITNKYVDFALKYGKVSSQNPVTAIALNKTEWSASSGESVTLTASVTPSDATYANVKVFSDNTNIVTVESVGNPTNGTTEFVLRAGNVVGSATVTVESLDTHVKKTISVCTKEKKPTAAVDFAQEKLTGLVSGKEYEVSVDGGEATVFLPNTAGEFPVLPAWMGHSISLVLKGATAKENSEPFNITIPERPSAPKGCKADNASSKYAADGIIYGITADCELRHADDFGWSVGSSAVKSDAKVGTYTIRIKATSTSFCSEAVEVTVGYNALSFADSDAYDIPSGDVEEVIKVIDLSGAVSGGAGYYVFTSSNSPVWVNVSPDGKITGTRPSVDAEATTMTVTVTDSDGKFASITVNVGKVKAHTHVLTHHDGKPANCTEDGYEAYDTCSLCDYTTYKSIDKLNHDITHHEGKEANCAENGWAAYDTCTRCDYTTYKATEKLNHDFSDEWTVDKEATTTAAGEKSRHCSRCSERTDITEIPKLAPAISFPDVAPNNWYYEAANYAVSRGLITGMDGKFAPNVTMSRGMLVTVLWRMEGSPKTSGKTTFTDLKQDWYRDAVIWAAENGIVNGTSATTFSPSNGITREQMAKMFMGYSEYKKYNTTNTTSLKAFSDNGALSSWAVAPMSWAVAEGLIGGSNGKLDPKGSATRAQVATILMRFCEKYN